MGYIKGHTYIKGGQGCDKEFAGFQSHSALYRSSGSVLS